MQIELLCVHLAEHRYLVARLRDQRARVEAGTLISNLAPVARAVRQEAAIIRSIVATLRPAVPDPLEGNVWAEFFTDPVEAITKNDTRRS